MASDICKWWQRAHSPKFAIGMCPWVSLLPSSLTSFLLSFLLSFFFPSFLLPFFLSFLALFLRQALPCRPRCLQTLHPPFSAAPLHWSGFQTLLIVLRVCKHTFHNSATSRAWFQFHFAVTASPGVLQSDSYAKVYLLNHWAWKGLLKCYHTTSKIQCQHVSNTLPSSEWTHSSCGYLASNYIFPQSEDKHTYTNYRESLLYKFSWCEQV